MPKAFLLIVEDDRITRLALTSILVRAGYSVKTTDSVLGGMNMISDDDINTAIIDLMLPDGDGEELIKRALAEDIKVIVTTGVGDESRIDRVRELQPDALMRKPISGAALLREIHNE